MSAVRCTFESEEKNPQGKHKKYYAGHFDSSDVEETMYLVIAEIFYAIPDGDGCIEIDNVKSKIPNENLIADMKVMKEEVIRVTWGNKIRHKLARLLLR